MPWSVDHGTFAICMSVTFHIFDISMMDTTVAVLKIFSCYLLPNRKSDGAETCWKVSRATWRFRIAKMVLF